MLEVDIRAPSIPRDQRVWRLFPGSGYKFLDAFSQQKVGFLDFPGFEMPKGKLSEVKDLIDRIAKSEKLAEDLRAEARGAKAKEGSKRKPKGYQEEGAERPSNRQFLRNRQTG